jgi:hypothetical protein
MIRTDIKIYGATNMQAGQEKAVDLNPAVHEPIQYVNFAALQTPSFIVTVDTEEEFDWSAPFTRDQHGTTHMAHIGRFQDLCDQNAVRPVYLIDYPIAADDVSVAMLGGYCSDGRADIGVQLHPWVNPPFHEEPNVKNSYACNLNPELERAKLVALYELIASRFAMAPKIYRAGRYGAGPNSRKILRDLGIKIDTSVRSLFDYTGQSGPNYADCSLYPYWIEDGAIIELPLTTVFSGAFKSAGKSLYSRRLEKLASRGILARTGLLERIALTPEGIPVAKAIKAIDIALDMEIPILNFSFHSPSLAAGHTPYVRNEEDLEHFYAWWKQVFAHLHARGVKPTHVGEIITAAGL